ncbi:hypothetical protein, conserved [Eimeria brunetti]|uniref:Uncharacterized protein n=1 Tax=Eimeria brunetti TaxID=51314 RepID=U6LQR1_9EIME|nr:hypothetical protein, conserved [Eimeria brunetti]
MTVAGSEGMVDVAPEAIVVPEVIPDEIAETEPVGEVESPEAPLEQDQGEQADVAPLEEASRERSSLAAVYSASTAQQSLSPQPNASQAGVAKRRAQLLGLAILLSLGIFLLRARVRRL